LSRYALRSEGSADFDASVPSAAIARLADLERLVLEVR